MVHETQAIEEFADAMFNQDICVDPADIVADGRLHRIHADGDGKNVKDAWYVLHVDDRPAGKYGHNGKYGHDASFSWAMKVDRPPMTAEEKRAYREKMEADRARREAEEAARHAESARLANRKWEASEPILGDDHPYLAAQGVQSYGLRRGTWEKVNPETGEISVISNNAIIVPIWAPGKKIHSLQAILPDGDRIQGRNKDYLSGANKRGHYFSIGKPLEHDGKQVILICEGYATGASLHAATNHAVIVAFDAPNLLPVAEVMRGAFPDATIIVCADNDQWTLKPVENPGLTRAREVRDAVGALIALPAFDAALGVANADGKIRGPNDFNDLMALEGAEAVRRVIADALNPPAAVVDDLAGIVSDDGADQVVEAHAPGDRVPGSDDEELAPWADRAVMKSVEAAESAASVSLEQGGDMPGMMFFQSATHLVPAGASLPALADSTDDDIGTPTDNKYFRCLGYKEDKYFFFHNESRQVKERTEKELTEKFMLGIAPLMWWETHFNNGKQGGINGKAALNFMMRACYAEGRYNDSRKRGRGTWLDEGRVVFHHGEHLTVDGATVELEDMKSRFAYHIEDPMPDLGKDIASRDECEWVLKTAMKFRWKMPASGALLAGWIALAPFCGVVEWRPHIWLTGGPGCGKSTALNKFLAPLVSGVGFEEEGIAVLLQGGSTEAGIRQTLKTESRPVLFDEMEANEEGDIRRIQNVLSLVRSASTKSGFKTVKGTAGGDAMSFHIQSMFAVASIQVAIKQQADIERLSVLELRDKLDTPEGAAAWADLTADLIDLKAEFSRRIINRSLHLLPTTLENIKTFVKAGARKFGTARHGDQYGTLLAGAWSLMSDKLATDEDADAMFAKYDWQEHIEPEADSRFEVLQSMMDVLVTANHEQASVAELVKTVMDGGVATRITFENAERVLGQHGFRVYEGALLIANKNQAIDELMQKTRFKVDRKGALLRIPGSAKVPVKHFPGGTSSRSVSIPIEHVRALMEDEPHEPGKF